MLNKNFPSKTFTAKRWFLMLLCSVVLILSGIVLLNVAADPFGVYGDNFFNWPSANMTNNPKTAKFTYIERHKGEFEAFIVGPSGSSGVSPATVEKYTGLKCYNMFNYGADMAYTARLTRYLIENHSPKHIILVMPVISASVYDLQPEDVTYYQPLKDNWQLPFLLADPKFALKKALNYTRRTYVQQVFNVFNASDGTYDKSRREVEPIGDMGAYLEAYPEFVNMPSYPIALTKITENVNALREVKELCDERGVALTVLAQPMLSDEILQYDPAEVERFFTETAKVTPFWSFVNTPVSHDPRYFYDITHYRNAVGDMMLAKIFGGADTSVYMPRGFGELVTAEMAQSAAARVFGDAEPETHERKLTVLMYHHIAETGDGGETISTGKFREHQQAIRDAGANTVTLAQLYDYVYGGVELPPKPVLITFDDGYRSNYAEAFPILKEYGHHAVIFTVGATFGKDEYMGKAINPHFGTDEAREMIASGLIEVESHTFDMHNAEGYNAVARPGALRLETETEEEYIAAFRADFQAESELISGISGKPAQALSYPHGLSDDLSAVLLNELGVKATFTTRHGRETIIKGLPASLLGLKRIAAGENMSGDTLRQIIDGEAYTSDGVDFAAEE
jgi:peptidoglycan/xylan/chitin deacetylase (PgdA/CDA1 family)